MQKGFFLHTRWGAIYQSFKSIVSSAQEEDKKLENKLAIVGAINVYGLWMLHNYANLLWRYYLYKVLQSTNAF